MRTSALIVLLSALKPFPAFIACFDGPIGGDMTTACKTWDVDADGDVDLRDFAAFQRQR